MTKEYDNRNRGVMFKNDRKRDDRDADYTGSYEDADGRQFFVDCWIKEGAKGKFLSFRTKEKTGRRQEAPASSDPFSDSVPF